jgi:hypothetical protein
MKILKRFRLNSEFNEFKEKYALRGTEWGYLWSVNCFVLSYNPYIELQEFYSEVLKKKLYVIVKVLFGIGFLTEADGYMHDYLFFVVEDPPEFESEEESRPWAIDFYEKHKDSPIEFSELFL